MENDLTGNTSENKPAKNNQKITKGSIIAALKTEERFQKYFQNFHPASIDSFINSYAAIKEMWCNDGEFYIKSNDQEDMHWINDAEEHLKAIQQKKLFDAQCLWRAGKIIIPEVAICFDFRLWEQNVLNCPFIEPINDDDIALYTEYLNDSNSNPDPDFIYEWQDYENIKAAIEEDEDDECIPEWYQFCNRRRGDGSLLLLPDIRGEKEDFYVNLHMAKNKEDNEEINEKEDAQRDKRPRINAFDENQIDLFVKTFEDRISKQYYQAYKRCNRNRDEQREMEDIIKLLLTAEEPVPIEAHEDFREALKMASQRLSAKKAAEFLPYAYDEYKLHKSMAFGPSSDGVSAMTKYQSIRKLWYDNIIHGRQLNSEPPDLNF